VLSSACHWLHPLVVLCLEGILSWKKSKTSPNRKKGHRQVRPEQRFEQAAFRQGLSHSNRIRNGRATFNIHVIVPTSAAVLVSHTAQWTTVLCCSLLTGSVLAGVYAMVLRTHPHIQPMCSLKNLLPFSRQIFSKVSGYPPRGGHRLAQFAFARHAASCVEAVTRS
jgi:hypothetical protein